MRHTAGGEVTSVGVVGGGPVGLVLAHRLHQAGIPVVVLDRGTGTGAVELGRAGMWEHRTLDTLERYGLAAGIRAGGRYQTGMEIRWFGESRMIGYGEWAGDVAHCAYPQGLLERDCRGCFTAAGGDLRGGVTVTGISELDAGDGGVIHYRAGDGHEHRLRCDFVIGADGAHGSSREAAPEGALARCHGTHPATLLAVFAETPSPAAGIVYATGEHGFAAHVSRTDTISRLYLQCAPDESAADWPAQRIWAAMDTRMALHDGPTTAIARGRILSVDVVPMRTQIIEPLRYRSLFLVGDAGHAITPFGAKGANLGIADATDLAESLVVFYRDGDDEPLHGYSERRLADVWRAQTFSRQLLDLLCARPTDDMVARRVRASRITELLAGGPLTEWFVTRYAGVAAA